MESSIEEDIDYEKIFKIKMSNDNAKKILESVFDKFEIRGAELYIFKQAVKRVLKENEEKSKIIDLMENYMVENGYEICFDHIYEELYNCNGMERDWCRGDELEKQDIHKYFSKKLLESEK